MVYRRRRDRRAFVSKWSTYLYLACLYICVIASPIRLSGQIGRLGTFDFLNMAASPRSTALGGYPITIADHDPAQGLANPALINPVMHGRLGLYHSNHFTDISAGYATYGYALDSTLSLLGSINYVDYGHFDRADDLGNRQGTFTGKDLAIGIGIGKKIDDRLALGAQVKFITSRLDAYTATGISADIGLVYNLVERRSAWAIVVRNVGAQLSTYSAISHSLPFDLQVGYSKRLAHLPLRWMVTLHHIHKWDLRSSLDEGSSIIVIGQEPASSSGLSATIDNLFRHMTFGGEILIGKNEVFRLRMGYDHLRNRELSLSNFRSFSGFSIGFGLKMNRWGLDYGLGRYHLAGSTHHIGLTLHVNRLSY